MHDGGIMNTLNAVCTLYTNSRELCNQSTIEACCNLIRSILARLYVIPPQCRGKLDYLLVRETF
jgi:hypothetical protein